MLFPSCIYEENNIVFVIAIEEVFELLVMYIIIFNVLMCHNVTLTC